MSRIIDSAIRKLTGNIALRREMGVSGCAAGSAHVWDVVESGTLRGKDRRHRLEGGGHYRTGRVDPHEA